MLGVIFILLATFLIYAFIAGTFGMAGKVVYNTAKEIQAKKEIPIKQDEPIQKMPIHQGCLAMNPPHLKELQDKGERLSKKQLGILELEQQARTESPVHFDKYEYHVPSQSCIPMIDSVEKLHELRAAKGRIMR